MACLYIKINCDTRLKYNLFRFLSSVMSIAEFSIMLSG